jgi:hypothetical protein
MTKLKYEDEKVYKFGDVRYQSSNKQVMLRVLYHIATSPSTFEMEILFS